MTDLNRVLAIRARTRSFHGRSAADEQVYFEVFAGDRSEYRMTDLFRRLGAAGTSFRMALGRTRPRRAKLT